MSETHMEQQKIDLDALEAALATCSLRTWIDWAEEVVHVEQ